MSDLPANERAERVWHWAKWVLLAAAIGLHSVQVCWIGNLHHGFINPDKAAQISAARGLLDGHGLTTPEPRSEDASEPVRKPLMQWPMGYSVLFAALWAVLGDLWRASLAIELLGTVLFFTAWLAIFEWHGKSICASVKLLVFSYWAFVWNPLIVQTCTEMVSLGMLGWAVAFCLRAASGRHVLRSSVAAALCMGVTAWFRFAYWPLLIITPATLAVACRCSADRRRLAVATLLNGALCGGLLLVVSTLQHTVTGYVTCLTGIRERELSGLTWSNLLRMCPFPSAAIGFADIWPFLIRHVRWLQRLPELQVDRALSVVVVLTIAVWGVKSLWRLRREAVAGSREPEATDRTQWATLVAAGLITTFITVVSLAYVSIRTPLDGDYTYLVERRYFGPLYPFASVGLACALVAFWRRREAGLYAVARVGLIALVVCWSVCGAVWRTQMVVRHRLGRMGNQPDYVYRDECRRVNEVVRRHLDGGQTAIFVHPRGRLWFCAYGERLPTVLALMAGAPCATYEEMQRAHLPPGKSVALLALVPDDPSAGRAQAEQFVRAHGFTRTVHLRDGWLYEKTWSAAAQTAHRGLPCPKR